MTEWRCGRREGFEGPEKGDEASRMLRFKSEPTRIGHRLWPLLLFHLESNVYTLNSSTNKIKCGPTLAEGAYT